MGPSKGQPVVWVGVETPALTAQPAAEVTPAPHRSRVDAAMRRLLRVPDRRPECPVTSSRAEGSFRTSMLVSALRCTVTYVMLPLLAPVVDLTSGVGPVLGLVVSAVSVVAIVLSMHRLFAADHRFRWGYTAVGSGVAVLLLIQAVFDVRALM